ncbi:hypothetical protein TTHERM_00016390 (macronuclear) [Tetrahymena thermophila SB210]|uniref:TOG domain-containing protein n=1 Tax=Tetrahymena thermophila (strain SB210) TaxID=312017 RepID=Q22RE9_TETTS|nr:hypothetical protein TTHERM_00016390 [Tetrahymena thermophila SB210]EAR88173.1 hypothetical protein TTHERM_00016390 [Tetrahymena thermophila SB210]|eukprot:XP_001008418.1 hypothetical protein TTHERM_00016390 [Tetrahymena thermophila SB210]
MRQEDENQKGNLLLSPPIQQQQKFQECQKKKEFKWTEIVAEQETVSEYILSTIANWDKFPLNMKIQVLEQFNLMIESTNFEEEEDIVLKSNCNFIDMLKHNNPKIVQITLKILILYTQKAQSINYNVPHLVSQLISKVMIRKEFREATIKLFMLIFNKCRDGLNFGIQELFSSSAPKPICETLNLFELLLLKKEIGMKEFLKQYLSQVYEYTQNQYQEVRSQALKLFVSLIKEYGESFIVPYKSKLKSNQIDFVNKQLQKDSNANSLKSPNIKLAVVVVQKKQLSNQSSHSNLSRPSQSSQAPNEKPSAATFKKIPINHTQNNNNGGGSNNEDQAINNQKINNELNTLSRKVIKHFEKNIFKKKTELQSKSLKDEQIFSMNDLSRSRSSINSKKQKKKHSDTFSQADQEDSSYEKNSEFSMKTSKENSLIANPQLVQLKKATNIYEKAVVKSELAEILEAGIGETKKKYHPKIEIKNRDKKASSVYKKEKSVAISSKKGSELASVSSKAAMSKSSSQSSLAPISKKFKSEQDLVFNKPKVKQGQSDKRVDVQSRQSITPNGVDEDSYYASPIPNKFGSTKNSPNKNVDLNLNTEVNNIQYSFSKDLSAQQNESESGYKFLQDLLHFENKIKLENSKIFNDKFVSNDSSIQIQEEETPFGIDNDDFYAAPNLDYNSDSDQKGQFNQDQFSKQRKSPQKADNVTPNGVDDDSCYAQPNSEQDLDESLQSDNIQNEETQQGDAMLQKLQQNQEKQQTKVKKDFAKKKNEEPKQKSRNSICSQKSTPNEDIQRQKEESENKMKQQEEEQQNVDNEMVQSIVLQKKQYQLNQDELSQSLLQVVEEESNKLSYVSAAKQLSDISLQMSFFKQQADNNNDLLNNPSNIIESNYLGQLSDVLKFSNRKEQNIPHFYQDASGAEEDKANNISNFYHFQDELNFQSQQKENSQNQEIRGYFFNQDLKDILSVVESAEQKHYFFNQQKLPQNKQQNSLSPNSQQNNQLPKPKESIQQDNKIKKKSSVHSQRSRQPSQSPHKQQFYNNKEKNGIKDEERENAKQIINKSQQMNDTVLNSYIFLFNDKLVNKLFQQQKDKIIYIVNKDTVNQWFNSREYDNVSIISFLIHYIGHQFEREDFSYLSKFWNFQKFLSFNNALIQSLTIHVMHQYFKKIQKYNYIKSNIKPKCLRDTINKLIKIIPVSRDKLFDESFAFLDFLFELDIYNDYIFDAISEVLQSNVPKQIVSSLRILSNFLRLYGEKRLNSLKPFMHIIKSISFSANLQVRNAAIEFYQEAYSWMGDSIFEYTKSLKRTQLLQLEKAFSQVILKERRPLKCPIEVFQPIMNDSLYEKEQNIFTSDVDEEIQKQESYIRKALAVQEWVNKDDLIQKIVDDASNQLKLREQNYSNIIQIILELLGDWNKYLIENTLILIKNLAQKLKKDFCQGGIELFEAVFELYSVDKSINRDKISKALVSLFVVAGLKQLLKIILKILAKKRNIKEILNVLNFGLRKSDAGCVIKIIQEVQIYLSDKDSNTKIAAFDLFGVIRYIYGNPIIEQNLNQEYKNNRFILQKIQESHVKCAKMKSLSIQKKKLEELKNSISNSYSNSEMSTASYDKQYFYVQIQNCSFSSKKGQMPIQQFKIQKKQELLQKQMSEEPITEVYQGSFVHEFLSEQQKQPHQNEDVDEI